MPFCPPNRHLLAPRQEIPAILPILDATLAGPILLLFVDSRRGGAAAAQHSKEADSQEEDSTG